MTTTIWVEERNGNILRSVTIRRGTLNDFLLNLPLVYGLCMLNRYYRQTCCTRQKDSANEGREMFKRKYICEGGVTISYEEGKKMLVYLEYCVREDRGCYERGFYTLLSDFIRLMKKLLRCQDNNMYLVE